MRKDVYSVKCPGRFQFGDPMYFETYTGKKLSGLVADCKPPGHFVAKVLLMEEPYEEWPQEMSRTMVLYMAPKETIDVYADGYQYEGQKVTQKKIGVDTAKYLIGVDGKFDEVRTGGDGYWGRYCEFSRGSTKGRILDAVSIEVCIPEFQDFADMQRMVAYLFQDAQILSSENEQGPQMKMP